MIGSIAKMNFYAHPNEGQAGKQFVEEKWRGMARHLRNVAL